ncbi:hypothetical protein KAFR_0I02480 [Kazachstania africana CBS 2517]|uniref:Uncharacterized protein n=1 Tax=Kazachstania africana (strain ATCC 22294 / BCRC 22015 / CBS 2517 / CECT 1963 / NBRC 1671 / NRRL Y-8276) TaxID=1071382 RepID=H2B077_KAZAF|nr:hypothetical protein KAFR_0I02480 [Kazachstania africana CBS 2517]CCF60027.1 hypothetical protein KAFR_0I02480 [Kazachstania africana CBS 2517]
MVNFRRKSNNNNTDQKVQVSKEDQARLKVRTASVADPILDAVQEAQPFEEAADVFHDNMNRQSYFSTGQGGLRDVFGQPIGQPDISNPTRSRDERPLDTIRSFEYAVSGDPTWGQQLETSRLGFNVRPDYPFLNTEMNPYNNAQNQMYAQQAVYQAPVNNGESATKKKKKRNFFGRKKKNAD